MIRNCEICDRIEVEPMEPVKWKFVEPDSSEDTAISWLPGAYQFIEPTSMEGGLEPIAWRCSQHIELDQRTPSNTARPGPLGWKSTSWHVLSSDRMFRPKFVQITSCSRSYGSPTLYALDMEGTVWRYERWEDEVNALGDPIWVALTTRRKET